MANQFEEMLKKMPPEQRAALDKRVNQDKRGAEQAGKAHDVKAEPATEKVSADPGKSATKQPTQQQGSGRRDPAAGLDSKGTGVSNKQAQPSSAKTTSQRTTEQARETASRSAAQKTTARPASQQQPAQGKTGGQQSKPSLKERAGAKLEAGRAKLKDYGSKAIKNSKAAVKGTAQKMKSKGQSKPKGRGR